MKRKIRRILVIALVTLALLIPPAVTMAAGEDSDNGCPPRAAQGTANISAQGADASEPISPPANPNAWIEGTDLVGISQGTVGTNRGNK